MEMDRRDFAKPMCAETSLKEAPISATPANLANAVEVLSNVLYLIELKADSAHEVRRCLSLAAPAMNILARSAAQPGSSARQ
jgi:hypothetical protein